MPGGAIRCGPGAGAARLRSAAPVGAQSQKNQRDRSTQNLGLTPPGYDLPPRSGLGTRQEGMPGGAGIRTRGSRRQATICRPGRGSIPEKSTGPLCSKPGADAARLRSAAPLGAGNAARRNARWRSGSGPGAGAARLRSAAPVRGWERGKKECRVALGSGLMSGVWKRSMAKLVRHRQPKGPDSDMPNLKPPRHTSTLLLVFLLGVESRITHGVPGTP